jgi:sugar fermentation stimulation protein A
MDSQAPNKVVKESLLSGKIMLPGMTDLIEVKSEASFGNSRLDFYVKDRNNMEGYIEVKGVTLERNGVALFPDAPTERGIKHLYELLSACKQGKKAFVIFVIQMKGVKYFSPNDETHAAFGQALREVAKGGVVPLAFDCKVGEDFLTLDKPVEIRL